MSCPQARWRERESGGAARVNEADGDVLIGATLASNLGFVVGDKVRVTTTEGVDDTVELGVDCGGVGLVIDRVQQRLDPPPR